MVKVDLFGKNGGVVVVGRGPPWSRKGLVMRGYNPNDNPSPLQTQAMVNLANASRDAASQTTQFKGQSARVPAMNAIVSEKLAGRGAAGGGYAPKAPHVGVHGVGFLARQAAKHGISYAGVRIGAGTAPAFAGGAFF